MLSDNTCATIEEIQVEKLAKPETTYNFEVEDYHTYYVTDSKVLVHNVCPKPTVDPNTGEEVGRFIVDENGNTMIEPKGGSTEFRSNGDIHTKYMNGSNYQRLNPNGHGARTTPHGHGHLSGTGPGMRGQGPSIDINGNVVPFNSNAAHWKIKIR